MAEKKWVATVNTDSTHPQEHLFNQDAETIAKQLGIEEGLAQGARLRHAHAELLHQPRWEEPERRAALGAREGEADPLRNHRPTERDRRRPESVVREACGPEDDRPEADGQEVRRPEVRRPKIRKNLGEVLI